MTDPRDVSAGDVIIISMDYSTRSKIGNKRHFLVKCILYKEDSIFLECVVVDSLYNFDGNSGDINKEYYESFRLYSKKYYKDNLDREITDLIGMGYR